MEVDEYVNIINDLRNINSLHVNDKYFNVLLKQYNVPEETLRSIIGLWYQRRVSQTASKIRNVDIYDLYKKARSCGVRNASFHVAENLDYPPTLIAKIIVTSYLAEIKTKKHANSKTTSTPKELNRLRRQQCSFCKSNNASFNRSNLGTFDDDTSIDVDRSTTLYLKKHDDPRIELALNLFDDEDDSVGKYLLDKFTFSHSGTKTRDSLNRLKSHETNRSDKFFWEASNFEEMGEQNVRRHSNVERLFSKQNVDEALVVDQSQISSTKTTDNCVVSKLDEKFLTLGIDDKRAEGSCGATEDVSEISYECASNSNSTINSSFDNSDMRKPDTKMCQCISNSESEDTDTDSMDSDETYENLNVKELLENPSLIEDSVLANDVFLCVTSDDQYGPTSDIIAYSSGTTHERLLEERVKEIGIPYKTENKLRGSGVDKTPDIILLAPVAVNNFVINWIESKALFADFKLHQDFENNQYKNYINRFGPGMVVYWHGYTVDVQKSVLVNKQIVVRDNFPSKENFTFINADKFKSWMR